MGRLRTAIGGLVAGALIFTMAGAGTAAANPNTRSDQSVNWQPCPARADADCATIKVPVDWAAPHGQTFELALGRLKATDPAHRIGSLLVNPGGPGASGIDGFILKDFFSPALRQRFDIVSWDPRGVGRSNPVMCTKALLDQASDRWPASEADYQNLLAYNTKLGADCRAHTGPVFDHVDTTSTVRDMDAIRAALGEQKVNFYGVSYGTVKDR